FVVGQSAPDSGVLAGLHGPFQAVPSDLAATADGLCLFDLEKRRAGVADREEQLGALVQAGRAIAPRHRIGLLESSSGESASCESAQGRDKPLQRAPRGWWRRPSFSSFSSFSRVPGVFPDRK